MTRKLSDADRAAVDLLLDRVQTDSGLDGNGNVDRLVVVTDAIPEDRLSTVQRILNTLDLMPMHEPSSDLAVRTLQRVLGSGEALTAPTPGSRAFIDPTQPLA